MPAGRMRPATAAMKAAVRVRPKMVEIITVDYSRFE
jgi:hypothetical protein